MPKIDQQRDKTAFRRAVVIGSSVTGLAAARVLADHFERVTIIERDTLPDIPDFRRGVPQARHAHLLLPQGQSILEQHFPGLTADLAAKGATLIDKDLEMQESPDGVWFNNVTSLICSRPLLENTIYQLNQV